MKKITPTTHFSFTTDLSVIELFLMSWVLFLMTNNQALAQGNCLVFDGVNQYVGSSANIPGSGDFTVSVWAQRDATQSGSLVEILSQGTSGNAFYIGMEPGGKIRAGDGWATTTTNYPTDNLWHQLTVTKTATNAFLYLDGNLVETHGSTIPNPSGSEFLVADQYGNNMEYFKGNIDEVSIWNRALTATEIATVLNRTLVGNENGLIHYYDFNQSSGTNLPDLTGSNQGTLYNGPVWVTSTALIVDDLQATGLDIKWYDSASGGNLLTSTTLLVNGRVYYASQTLNSVESTSRLAVTATLNPQPQGTLSANGPFCVTGAGTLSWLATAGTGPYTVVYNDGTANRTVSNVSSATPFAVFTTPVTGTTTYTLVSVQDVNCTRSTGFKGGTATITVNPLPTPTFVAEPGATAFFNTNLTYTTQSGKSNYIWTFPGISGTDYTITSGGTTADNSVTLQYLNTGTKTVTIQYSANGCSTASATSSIATTIVCGGPISINHLASNGVAPVNKTVTYGTASTTVFGGTKCVITRNLGASQQASSQVDDTEAAAGWYWQFNQKQGYSHDGTTRTPNTTWIHPLDDPSDWLPTNDPCTLELGVAWRIPTYTEWYNALLNLPTPADAFASALKIHSGGSLYFSDGALASRGLAGYQWTGSKAFMQAGNYMMFFGITPTHLGANNMSQGYSIRCINDVLPTSATTVVTTITATSASSGGTVTYDGGSNVTSRGICWGTSTKPTVALATKTSDGSGTGTFTSTITGLTGNTIYYVRAYATNNNGTSYGNEYSFTTFLCGVSSLQITHVTTDGVAPVDKTVTYSTVTNILGETGKCWITSNLGASNQATAYNDTDESSAGWYWQFNSKEGFKMVNTGVDVFVRTPNTTWTTTITENSDWTTANDPCSIELGSPWRIPTYTEWNNVNTTGVWVDWNGPWNSGLKLHAAGYVRNDNGEFLWFRGSGGSYWSSTQHNDTNAWHYYFSIGSSYMTWNSKAFGNSVRCIRDY